ncbi:GtrA family protein [Parvibaculum sedimenti]|uniref:GtrA family protein n=1 Tax=Parvibaculum sedimenti TaxID=2608632 RepID=A0A6N6VGA1_9HYPH|nr:GtrA family protein [Parvibaculum sedimenti]KAB7738387.1 GtrA family protein [Parvibaculum sedimenti]
MKPPRLLRYAAAGTLGTATQYTILLCLVRTGTAEPLIASSGGAIAGAIVNYLLNYRFTFGSHKSHIQVAPKFFLTACFGFVINWAVMTVLILYIGIHYLVAQILSTGIVLMLTYAVNAGWSFRQE